MLVRTVNELQSAPHINCQPRRQVDHFVTVTECEDKSFAATRENSAVIGMLLQIRHNSMVTEDRRALVTTGARYAPGANVVARQRLGGGNRTYDRLALFADTREPGRCFAMIYKNSAASTNFFSRCIRTHEGVGNVFFLDEPTPVTSTLGSTASVPIIESVWDALPISNPIDTLLPNVPLLPPDMGCTRYFCSHNVRELQFHNASFVDSVCTGVFCDRQLCTDTVTNPQAIRCGCFHYDRSSAPLTIQFDIAMPCPLDFDQSGITYISGFRSYRTTLLFIKKDTLKYVKKNDSNDLNTLRNAVREVVQYVNNNGGWSIVGWLRTGTVHDISETQGVLAENLASTTQTPHVSFLYPTNSLLVNEDNQYFTNLRMIALPSSLNENNVNNDNQLNENNAGNENQVHVNIAPPLVRNNNETTAQRNTFSSTR